MTLIVSRFGSDGVGKRHACVQSAEQVVDDLLVYAFTGQDDRDPRRIRGDLLGGDPPDSVLGFYVFELAEERVTGADDRLQFERAWVGNLDRLRPRELVSGVDETFKRPAEPVGRPLIVGGRNRRDTRAWLPRCISIRSCSCSHSAAW
jgi:hypothetical protein